MKHKTKLLALLLAVVMIFTATALISCTSEDLTSAHPKETVVTFSDTLNSENSFLRAPRLSFFLALYPGDVDLIYFILRYNAR